MEDPATRAEKFTDAARAVERITEIHQASTARLRDAFEKFGEGEAQNRVHAPYPMVSVSATHGDLSADARPSFGVLLEPGLYSTTLTRPDLFADYYREQLHLLIERHGQPVWVAESERQIPIPFVTTRCMTVSIIMMRKKTLFLRLLPGTRLMTRTRTRTTLRTTLRTQKKN